MIDKDFWRRARLAGQFSMAAAWVFCLHLPHAMAFTDEQKGIPVAHANDKVEVCVERLREAPAHEVGSAKLAGENFKLISIGDKDASAEFTRCIDAAKTRRSNLPNQQQNVFTIAPNLNIESNVQTGELTIDVSRLDRGGPLGEDMKLAPGLRYLYSDQYQKKYLIDVAEKKYFELVRIPPAGSIESLGTWTGTVTSTGGCKNSYGEPCGTQYQHNGAGWVKK